MAPPQPSNKSRTRVGTGRSSRDPRSTTRPKAGKSSGNKIATLSVAVHGILDHTAFPHILDTVIATAPSAALRVLRQTSQAVKKSADARLFAHIAVCASLAGELELRSPTPPHDRLPCWLNAFSVQALQHIDPARSTVAEDTGGQCQDAPGQPAIALASVIPHTRVLDLYPLPTTFTSRFLSSYYVSFLSTFLCSFKGLTTLRRSNPDTSPLHIPASLTTVIDWVDMTAHLGPNRTLRGGYGVAQAKARVPPGTRTHVLRLAYDAGAPLQALLYAIYQLSYPSSVNHAIVVFARLPKSFPNDDERGPHGGGAGAGAFHDRLGMMYGLVVALIPLLARGGRVTFVGVERMHAIYLDLGDADGKKKGMALVDRVAHEVGTRVRGWESGFFADEERGEGLAWGEEDREAAVERIAYLTHDQWQKTTEGKACAAARGLGMRGVWTSEHGEVMSEADWEDESIPRTASVLAVQSDNLHDGSDLLSSDYSSDEYVVDSDAYEG